jgi:signal transduction histidine kinase
LSVAATDGLVIRADERLLFEAISNLVENAIKFAPENSTVTMALRALPDAVAIEVRDSGAGIPEGERERVQRRFERGGGGDGARLRAGVESGGGHRSVARFRVFAR